MRAGSQAPLGWLFALSAVLVVAGQLWVTRWLRGRDEARVLAAGFAVTTAAFLLVAVVLAAGGEAGPRGWAGLVAPTAFVVLLTAGQMIVLPLTRALVPRLAGESRLGAYYGVLASVSGVAVLVGSTALGGVVQLAAWPAAPWLAAALLPAASAVAITRVLRAVPVAAGTA